jgi:hypothetical protein
MTAQYIYYVYAYIRKSNGTPYYIGKGKGKRAFGPHGKISVPKDKTKIVFLETKLTNVGACALERRLIRWWGKKVDNTGILLNISDGGDGRQGPHSPEAISKMGGKPRSEETKRKLSKVTTGIPKGPMSEEHKAKLRRPMSEEHKTKLRGPRGPQTPKGPMSEEHKDKLRGPRGPHKNPMTPEQKREAKRKMWETRKAKKAAD